MPEARPEWGQGQPQGREQARGPAVPTPEEVANPVAGDPLRRCSTWVQP
jgi:hypothetical protein